MHRRYEPQYAEEDYPLDRMEEPVYETQNLMEDFGSIIKDLTDTDDMLWKFELRLQGKAINDEGKIVKVREAYMDERKINEFIDIIKSIVNQNTHFTKYGGRNVEAILAFASEEIPRWMMLQGEAIPRRNRAILNLMSMNLINESLHKANEGTILRWSKGTFSEGTNITQDMRRGGFLNKLFGGKKGAR